MSSSQSRSVHRMDSVTTRAFMSSLKTVHAHDPDHIFLRVFLRVFLHGFLNGFLKAFWGDKAKAWSDAIIGADNFFNTERPENMITLNLLVHVYWDSCQCAFRPVRVADDGLSMDLLEMLWILKRIAAMQGAAETEEDDVESDNGSPSVPDIPL